MIGGLFFKKKQLVMTSSVPGISNIGFQSKPFSCYTWLTNGIITVRNSSCGKVMFLQVSVCPQGEVYTPSPQADTHPSLGRHPPGKTHTHPKADRNIFVTFNERFIQCFAFCTQVLGTYLPVNWLTKSSSHTSLNLTNSGLVVTTLGPNNFG